MPSSSSSATPETTTVAPTVTSKMPNMARTLLLNQTGLDRQNSTTLGEEYVPPYYRPVELSSDLLNVRRALFGTTPDDAGMNYSVWQYMRVLHSTEYAAYVTDLDSRITYLNDKSMLDYTYGVSTQPVEAIEFTGDPGLGGADGRLRAAWNLTLSGGSIDIECITAPRFESFNITVEDGLSSYVPLVPYDDYKARIDTTAGVTKWTVEYVAKASVAMGLVRRAEAITKISASAYEALFPRREPYTLFKQLWEQHPWLSYKLSGVLLALIYLTNEARTGNA